MRFAGDGILAWNGRGVDEGPGYLCVVDMFPLDFAEFCWANGVDEDAIAEPRRCFEECIPVFAPVHERLLALFHHYLIAGGMPAGRTPTWMHDRERDSLSLAVQKGLQGGD